MWTILGTGRAAMPASKWGFHLCIQSCFSFSLLICLPAARKKEMDRRTACPFVVHIAFAHMPLARTEVHAMHLGLCSVNPLSLLLWVYSGPCLRREEWRANVGAGSVGSLKELVQKLYQQLPPTGHWRKLCHMATFARQGDRRKQF